LRRIPTAPVENKGRGVICSNNKKQEKNLQRNSSQGTSDKKEQSELNNHRLTVLFNRGLFQFQSLWFLTRRKYKQQGARINQFNPSMHI
jgi:hypothetical protein